MVFFFKQKQPAGSVIEKIVSGYHVVYGGKMDEDAVFSNCRNAISFLEKIDKEMGGDFNSGIGCIWHHLCATEFSL